MAAVLASFLAVPSSPAQTLTTVYTFAGAQADGFYPMGNLVVDSQGNVYGTTTGIGNECKRGSFNCGTIFKVTPAGTETTLHSFATGSNARPMSGLFADSAGNFYGTTHGTGGATQLDGTVFRLKKQKNVKSLYTFRGNRLKPGDGANPAAGVVMDSNGNLYGTTEYGGVYGFGTVYEISANGTETILHNFSGGSDGGYPASPLLLDAQGNLYGTIQGFNCCGDVFKITPAGAETILYTFAGEQDGAAPYGGLIMDSHGNLYGTTSEGGGSTNCGNGCGTVFKLTPSGAETVLYRFSGAPDGAVPLAGLAMDSHGNLFGTTYSGGTSPQVCYYQGCGTVFEISAGGAKSTLYNFCSGTNCSDGAEPYAPLTIDAQGNLYGTTYGGGTHSCDGGCGTVFKLNP